MAKTAVGMYDDEDREDEEREDEIPSIESELEWVQRLSTDLRKAAMTLGSHEIRFILANYYVLQQQRIRTGNQLRMLEESEEPTTFERWLHNNYYIVERELAKGMAAWVDNRVTGRWLQTIPGIGPTFAAACVVFIDPVRQQRPSQVWRYAGLDPTHRWIGRDEARKLVREHVAGKEPTMEELAEIGVRINRKLEAVEKLAINTKGELSRGALEKGLARRPWNADFKRACYLIGESFIKQQNRDNDIYGHVFAWRRAWEQDRNKRGLYREQAERQLAERNFRPGTVTRKSLEQGMLSDGQIHNRARRFAVKLFLANAHQVIYFDRYGREPERPWINAHGGHERFISAPNFDPTIWPEFPSERVDDGLGLDITRRINDASEGPLEGVA